MAGLKFGGSTTISANSESTNLLVGSKLQQLFAEGMVRLRARVMTTLHKDVQGGTSAALADVDLSSVVTSSYVSGQTEIAADVPVNRNLFLVGQKGTPADNTLLGIDTSACRTAVGPGDEVFSGEANPGVQQWTIQNNDANQSVVVSWTAELLS